MSDTIGENCHTLSSGGWLLGNTEESFRINVLAAELAELIVYYLSFQWLVVYFKRLTAYVATFAFVLVFKLLLYIGPFSRAMQEKLNRDHPTMKVTFLTWRSLPVLAYHNALDFSKHSRPGNPAVDITLHTLRGDTTSLLDRQKSGRPLVVNVGSCS